MQKEVICNLQPKRIRSLDEFSHESLIFILIIPQNIEYMYVIRGTPVKMSSYLVDMPDVKQSYCYLSIFFMKIT